MAIGRQLRLHPAFDVAVVDDGPSRTVPNAWEIALRNDGRPVPASNLELRPMCLRS